MKAKMMHEEKRETPKMEAQAHSKKFLQKALSAKSAAKIRTKLEAIVGK